MLEYILAVNTDAGSNSGLLWGDKDTFPLGFALAMLRSFAPTSRSTMR